MPFASPGQVILGKPNRRYVARAGAVAFATFDPANKSADITLSNGNRTAARSATTDFFANAKMLGVKTAGDWHVEFSISGYASGTIQIGVSTSAYATNFGLGGGVGSAGYGQNGNVSVDGNTVGTVDTFGNGDTIAVEYRAALGELYVQKVGGTGRKGPFSVPAGAGMRPAIASDNTTGSTAFLSNAGQTAFAITPTSGFSAWSA